MNRATSIIRKELPTWNECIAWAKSGDKGMLYAVKKKATTKMLAEHFSRTISCQFTKVSLNIHWGLTHKRKDPDNIASGVKFILDGLTTAYILPGDSWRNVASISHTFSKEPKTYIRVDLIGD